LARATCSWSLRRKPKLPSNSVALAFGFRPLALSLKAALDRLDASVKSNGKQSADGSPQSHLWKQPMETRRHLAEKGLPPIKSLSRLAHATGAEYQYLRQVIARSLNPYEVFAVDKRQGGFRAVVIPEPQLMAVQRWIAKKVLNLAMPHERSFAFSPGSSIIQCAKEHCGCRWLLKFDVRRFFESIAEDQIYRVFRRLGYRPLIAFELARICTREKLPSRVKQRDRWMYDGSRYAAITAYRSDKKGHLPQGAPTSPMLANLTSFRLDCLLQHLADEHQLMFTRYADDLIFSTKRRDFSRRSVSVIVRRVYALLRKNQLQPHTAKTHVSPPGARKVVLGLLVDGDQPRLTRAYRSRLQRHLWGIERFGLVPHAEFVGFGSPIAFYHHVRGLVSYARQVEPAWIERVLDVKDPLGNYFLIC
jgi:RNA-directed DNA polymerase